MNNYNHLIINKNRGWRGLAEAKAIDLDTKETLRTIFSFSQAMWNDLVSRHLIVMQDEEYYYIIRFADPEGRLPSPTQQRSVLIKSFNTAIKSVTQYKKTEWTSSDGEDWQAIFNFRKNKNNHTTSDWNCIRHKSYPIYIVNRLERSYHEKQI